MSKGAKSYRRIKHSVAALMACASAACVPYVASATTAARAQDLLNGIGVNTHTIYTDSLYANTAKTVAAMQYLGLRLIRDVSPNPANQGQSTYATLAKSGLVMDLFVGGDAPGGSQNPATAVASIAALATAYPGSVHAVEGPNEVITARLVMPESLVLLGRKPIRKHYTPP